MPLSKNESAIKFLNDPSRTFEYLVMNNIPTSKRIEPGMFERAALDWSDRTQVLAGLSAIRGIALSLKELFDAGLAHQFLHPGKIPFGLRKMCVMAAMLEQFDSDSDASTARMNGSNRDVLQYQDYRTFDEGRETQESNFWTLGMFMVAVDTGYTPFARLIVERKFDMTKGPRERLEYLEGLKPHNGYQFRVDDLMQPGCPGWYKYLVSLCLNLDHSGCPDIDWLIENIEYHLYPTTYRRMHHMELHVELRAKVRRAKLHKEIIAAAKSHEEIIAAAKLHKELIAAAKFHEELLAEVFHPDRIHMFASMAFEDRYDSSTKSYQALPRACLP